MTCRTIRLKTLAHSVTPRRPVILIIMDGVGVNPSKIDNAVALAKTPNLDDIYANYPSCLLEASGRAVGLPDGQMGNSEVGHLTLGAGTVLKQDLVKISDSIEDGSFYNNEVLLSACQRAADLKRPLHLIGLVSDGGVHSHLDHLLATIELCAQQSVVPELHMIADGRDTAPVCAARYIEDVEAALARSNGYIASVCGRYFAMDRDKRWDRVQQAFDCMVHGQGRAANDIKEALGKAAAADESDEFISPTRLDAFTGIQSNDSVLFFNFRNDRPRELCEALAMAEFSEFDRGAFEAVQMTTMTRYSSQYSFPFAFDKDSADKTLGMIVSEAGIDQLRSAETEKYPHVTFFFNGGRDEPLPGEARLLVDSPKVATYDLQPEMSASEVASGIESALEQQHYGLIVVNFANGDMVGHTGVKEAVIRSVEVVDSMVGRLWEKAQASGYSIVLTADHGNADRLTDPVTKEPHTQHTTFPVACVVYDETVWELSNGRGLPSVAPTILQLMGLPQPESMGGRSLLLGPYR
ncbi:MAG: 2,3-bisphosphoglycerate-independent phosphoglycerate mutase [Gammaproteobacteria bacterium]|nr:2,3-bisphosphoglycerate-independent phosphoglycerate mutase [Gammaproteobacteria bacterium]